MRMIQIILTHITMLVIFFVPTYIVLYLTNTFTGMNHEIDTIFLSTLFNTFIMMSIGYPAYIKEEDNE